MNRLFISAGHGGKDPGAVSHDTTEHKEVAEVAKEFVKLMQGDGVEVILVPLGKTLGERTLWLRNVMSVQDGLIELHMNAAASYVSGAEAFIINTQKFSRKFANEMLDEYCKFTKLEDRGVKYDIHTRHKRLGILRDTPGQEKFLLELGFLTNKKDLKTVREMAVLGLVRGVKKYLGIEARVYTPQISKWAKGAVEKAKKKGITKWDNPQEVIGTKDLWYTMRDIGGIDGDEEQIKHVTKEMFVTWADRNNLLD